MKKYSSKQGSSLVKTANGFKIKLSKKEWTRLGKEAGWFKKASEEHIEKEIMLDNILGNYVNESQYAELLDALGLDYNKLESYFLDRPYDFDVTFDIDADIEVEWPDPRDFGETRAPSYRPDAWWPTGKGIRIEAVHLNFASFSDVKEFRGLEITVNTDDPKVKQFVKGEPNLDKLYDLFKDLIEKTIDKEVNSWTTSYRKPSLRNLDEYEAMGY